jgi:hypothetical protein
MRHDQEPRDIVYDRGLEGKLAAKNSRSSISRMPDAPDDYSTTTQQPASSMHCTPLDDLGMLGDQLQGIDTTPKTNTAPCRHNSSRQDNGARRSRSLRQPRVTHRDHDALNDISQSRVDKAHEQRSQRRSEYDEDEENKLNRATCFTLRVRKTELPKGFKLPTDKIKIRRRLGASGVARWLPANHKGAQWHQDHRQAELTDFPKQTCKVMASETT